jgi:hypothetical protein
MTSGCKRIRDVADEARLCVVLDTGQVHHSTAIARRRHRLCMLAGSTFKHLLARFLSIASRFAQTQGIPARRIVDGLARLDHNGWCIKP